MSKYVINAISGNMFDLNKRFDLCWEPLTLDQVKNLLVSGEWKSGIGHADFASLLTGMTSCKIGKNRIALSLELGDKAILAQYKGPRLEEGATTLPKGANIQFALVYPAEHVSRK